MKRLRTIVIIGASGHGKSVYEAVSCGHQYRVAGFIDDSEAAVSSIKNCPVLGRIEDINKIIKTHHICGGIVAIGDNYIRQKCMLRIQTLVPGFEFVSIIHPSATISVNSLVGEGTCVLGASFININCRVGRGCILNTGSILEHDCELGDYASLAPGVCVGGNVSIGQYSAISIGATLIHDLSVGNNTLVGAGSVIVRDLPENVIAYGVPGKIIRNRKLGESYF